MTARHLPLRPAARWALGALRALAALGALWAPFNAQAQDYPNRPIRIVVPFSPGGAVDGSTRAIAQELERQAAH